MKGRTKIISATLIVSMIFIVVKPILFFSLIGSLIMIVMIDIKELQTTDRFSAPKKKRPRKIDRKGIIRFFKLKHSGENTFRGKKGSYEIILRDDWVQVVPSKQSHYTYEIRSTTPESEVSDVQTGDILIHALGKMGDSSAVMPLLDLSKHASSAIERECNKAIALIQSRLGSIEKGGLSLSIAGEKQGGVSLATSTEGGLALANDSCEIIPDARWLHNHPGRNR